MSIFDIRIVVASNERIFVVWPELFPSALMLMID